MNKKFLLFLVFLFVFLIIIVMFIKNIYANNSLNGNDDKYTIFLKSRQFIPEKGINENIKFKIINKGKEHVILQFENIPNSDERTFLEENGIKLIHYIPNNAWSALITDKGINFLDDYSNVRSVIEFLPEDKKSDSIKSILNSNKNYHEVMIIFFNDVSLNDGEKLINKYGGKIAFNRKGPLIGWKSDIMNSLVVNISLKNISLLIDDDSIRGITIPPTEIKSNMDHVRLNVGANNVQTNPYNLNGTGISVLIYDNGRINSSHPDFGNRVNFIDNTNITEHPTQIAGVLGGSGMLSNGTYRGIAPNVSMVSGDFYDEIEYEYENAITNYSADLATNSWTLPYDGNCSYFGDYDIFSQCFDYMAIGINVSIKLPIVFSAGNFRDNETCGTDPLNYSNNYRLILPPATAKNVITVGAIYSDNDYMTDYSEWGPTDDGRIKPDLVAPGDNSLSAAITTTDINGGYGLFFGTSAAAPVVAGATTLMIERWLENHSSSTLPSTIKAVLIETCKDLGNTGPDFKFGYGNINITRAINLIDSNLYNKTIHESYLTEINNSVYYNLSVPLNQSEIKITLVWDDYAADIGSSKTLVNDLDLIVKSPNGTIFYPWTLDPNNPSISAVRNKSDHINNVEQVYVNTSDYEILNGTWTIEIDGSIVTSNQTYSLVTNYLNTTFDKFSSQTTNLTCVVLSEPNKIYTLTQNISSLGTCLNITANNITIDGNGYKIEYGINSAGNAIYANGYSNINIKNLFIEMNNFTLINSPGIYIKNGKSMIINNNSLLIKGPTSSNADNYGIYLINVNFSSIFSNIINTNNEHGYGIYIYTESGKDSSNNNINNNNLKIEASTSHGIFLDSRGILINTNISSNIINCTNLVAGGSNGIHINTNPIAGSTTNNTFISSNTIVTNMPGSYGIDLVSSSDNIIKDSFISSVNDSDVIVNSGKNNVFLNSSYLDEAVTGELIRKWYLNIKVNETNGSNVNQANVTGWNVSGAFAFSELTNSNGVIETQELIEYINNAGTKTCYTNYTINVTKEDYKNRSQSVNLTTNLNLVFTLESAILPNDPHKFIVETPGYAVAWISTNGNIALKGKCFFNTTCDAPGDDSFMIRNLTDYLVAFINSTGDLCIIKGDCSDESATCNNMSREGFIFRNSSDDITAYIDFDGEMCLIGKLYENSNP
jgi:hypothetical protein